MANIGLPTEFLPDKSNGSRRHVINESNDDDDIQSVSIGVCDKLLLRPPADTGHGGFAGKSTPGDGRIKSSQSICSELSTGLETKKMTD